MDRKNPFNFGQLDCSRSKGNSHEQRREEIQKFNETKFEYSGCSPNTQNRVEHLGISLEEAGDGSGSDGLFRSLRGGVINLLEMSLACFDFFPYMPVLRGGSGHTPSFVRDWPRAVIVTFRLQRQTLVPRHENRQLPDGARHGQSHRFQIRGIENPLRQGGKRLVQNRI